MLGAIPSREDENLLVGYDTADDAAVYRLNDDTCLIQTVDFFTPIVDDPEDFGEITAANSLSDVYAMGGRPLTALSLVCYPYKTWPIHILQAIMAGGARKVLESGALVVGGHSVADDEIKFGYAITGTVAADAFWRNNTPEPGDVLVLTKPLGTGTLTTAIKKDLLGAEYLEEPVAEMKRLNACAAELAQNLEVHAATDITGFGLMGHLYEMLKPRGYGAKICCEALPVFPGVWEAIKARAFTGAHTSNREYVCDYEIPETTGLETYGQILFDPQTSGGLMLALPKQEATSYLSGLNDAGHRAAIIGEVTAEAVIRCE